MTDAPKRIWAEPPDIFDGMGFWRDASFPTGSPYILAALSALAEASEVQALIAEAVERATRVKPLVWTSVGPDELLADNYRIKVDGFTLRLWYRDLHIVSSRDIDGIAMLQSIAGTHHEQRIRAAIGGEK